MSHSISFMPRFVEAIQSGAKRQTVRRTVLITPGDTILLTSQVAPVADVRCVRVERIEVQPSTRTIWLLDRRRTPLTEAEADRFAVADGLKDAAELCDLLRMFYKEDVFKGVVIH